MTSSSWCVPNLITTSKKSTNSVHWTSRACCLAVSCGPKKGGNPDGGCCTRYPDHRGAGTQDQNEGHLSRRTHRGRPGAGGPASADLEFVYYHPARAGSASGQGAGGCPDAGRVPGPPA